MRDLDLTSYSKEDLMALRTEINQRLTKINEEENLKKPKQLNARDLTILLFFILHGYYNVDNALLIHNREDINYIRPYFENTQNLINNAMEFESQKSKGDLTDIANFIINGVAGLRAKIKLIKSIVRSVYVLDLDFIEKHKEVIKSLLSPYQKENLNKIMKKLVKEMVFIKGTMSFYKVYSNFQPIQMNYVLNLFGLNLTEREVV